VTTAGQWTLTSNTVGGMTFTGSGTFAGTGTQNIVLTGSGNPSATGQQTLSVTAGTSTCTFVISVGTTPVPSSDYYPRTTNSNWAYEFDDDPLDTLQFRVIAPTHAALGNTYNIFIATDDASQGYDSSGYYRKSGGTYYEWRDAGAIFGFDQEIWQETIFLKDDQAANHTWNSPSISGTISGTPFLIREKYTILQKDVSVTVNGTPYPNTIVVEIRLEQNNGVSWQDISAATGILKSYYSRGVGLIKQELTSASGNVKLELFRKQVF
jgi:hypothetical protein